MTEDDIRLKRLKIRSWRRGIKEMDLILGRFCDDEMAGLGRDEVALYEDMLSENDHDLYQWVNGHGVPPERYAGLIERIARHARGGKGTLRSA